MNSGKTTQTSQTPRHLDALGSLSVDEVLRHWPSTAQVFVRYRLACVGCIMAPFERTADVPGIYGIDGQSFMREVEQAIHAETQERTE